MVTLDDNLIINHGTVRACYHHPERSNRIIKVPTGERKESLQANMRELKGYQLLIQDWQDTQDRQGSKSLSCISHCYGFEQTNLGNGLVCDGIYDSDGSISKSILDLIISESPPDFSYLKKVVEEFSEYLLTKDIFVFDLNVKNIVMQNNEGELRPYLIDLKGRYEFKEFLPFARFIPYFKRKKLQRRCRQLLERTIDRWERRDEFIRKLR